MKTKFLLLMLAMSLTIPLASAHDFEANGIYYNITSETDKTVEVTYKGTSYTSAIYSGNVTILSLRACITFNPNSSPTPSSE